MGLLNFCVRLVRYAVLSVGGLAGVGFTLIVVLQRKLIYVPSLPGAPRELYQFKPERYGLSCEELWLRTEDGVRLHAWLCAARAAGLRRAAPTLLFLQENAGNISHRLQNVKALIDQLGCNVLLLSYRGFGKSDGSPTEAGLQLDAQAALDFLKSRKDLDPSRLVVFGRSLGGAVAVALAAANPASLRCVVLENTFTSIPDMAGCVLPLLAHLVGKGKPFTWLVQDAWRSEERISQVLVPILFLCSGLDEMVPPQQMRALWALRSNQRSVWLEFPRAHHMDAWATGGPGYWAGFKSFLTQEGVYEDAQCAPTD